jgi:hypothetical protein
MVKRIAPVGVVSFVLVAVCGAACQNVATSLPDAPSIQAVTQAQRVHAFAAKVPSLLQFYGMGRDAGMARSSAFEAAPCARESKTIFDKYLNPTVVRHQSSYHSADSGSLMGRATSAASRILVTRDDSGKARLNTTYLLRTLTSAMADTASTPYWRRSVGEPFGDFGSTIGNDAGMNLWREFGPSIEQVMKSHTPKFVARIQERIGHK